MWIYIWLHLFVKELFFLIFVEIRFGDIILLEKYSTIYTYIIDLFWIFSVLFVGLWYLLVLVVLLKTYKIEKSLWQQ